MARTHVAGKETKSAAALRKLHKSVLEHRAKGEVEEWRDVPGFEGYWVASSMGRVARIQGLPYSGYSAISIPGGRGKGHPTLVGVRSPKAACWSIPIHRIVALTFLGMPPEGKNDVNHKNGIKSDNHLSNLEWNSRKENLHHAHVMKLNTSWVTLRKYTLMQYRKARELRAQGKTYTYIAKKLKMTVGGAWCAIHVSKKGRD